jgi:hypothetical protein
MKKTASWMATSVGLVAGVIVGWWLAAGPLSRAAMTRPDPDKLPRFTEEREAAALHFVKKHLPELLPVLGELKKSSPSQYEREIREIFNDTETLTEMSDDTQRFELELKIWKTENKAHLLVAKLSTPSAETRKMLEEQIQGMAKELVDFDIKILEARADQLDKELGEVKDEMDKMKENKDKMAKERYQALLDKARRGKK